MDRSRFPMRFLLCVCFVASALVSAKADTPESHPNMVVILADDVGWGDAGCYGATKLKTPNIDRLARDGIRFDDGHASAAVCTPTRYSLITGQYSWRRQASGLNRGVASGDSPLLIPSDMPTAPGLLKQAGYRTAMVGKWHLGFGIDTPDFNRELRPGPLEIGFDEFFGLPATNDRVPTVFIRDYRVVNLDPNDPIEVSFDDALAKKKGMSRYAAGRERIGWTKGGKSAWWKDINIADTFTREGVQFIARNKDRKFFLLFTPHDVHAPIIPHPRFVGTSGLGARGDMLLELDWSIGELLNTLDRHGLADNTLVVYSSDNGAYINDENGHKPTGPYRGKKSQLWEGGHRVPFIVRWPARINPGTSTDLVSTLDIPATLCAAAGIELPTNALPDSFNLLPSMLGKADSKTREHLVLMSGNGDLAIRSRSMKYVPDLATANGWYSEGKQKTSATVRPGLYDLSKDPSESKNLIEKQPQVAQRLSQLLNDIKSGNVVDR